MSFRLLLLFALMIGSGCSSSLEGDSSPRRDAGPDRVVEASAPDAGDGRADSREAREGGILEGAVAWKTAPHVAWPAIPDHGGQLLDPLRVVTVVAEDDPLLSDLQSFGDAIPTSAWFAAFASEYGLTHVPTHVQVSGAHVDPGTNFTLADMKDYIATTVAAASPSPAPDGRSVYVFFLPPGTNLIVDGLPDTTCSAVPYHAAYGTLGDAMAVLPRCQYTFPSLLAMFTTDAAHEIAEAATDSEPVTNPAWELWPLNAYKPWNSSVWNEVEMISSLEIGDPCIFTRVYESGFNLQRIFSNTRAATGGDPCVPALSVPYFSVSPDPATGGWFEVTAGSTVDVPLTGWSTAATDDWVVSAARGNDDIGETFKSTITSATSQVVQAHVYATSNNGRALTLTVRIPNHAQAGWWAAVAVWSWHTDSTGSYLAGEDFGHESVVGFYVP